MLSMTLYNVVCMSSREILQVERKQEVLSLYMSLYQSVYHLIHDDHDISERLIDYFKKYLYQFKV